MTARASDSLLEASGRLGMGVQTEAWGIDWHRVRDTRGSTYACDKLVIQNGELD